MNVFDMQLCSHTCIFVNDPGSVKLGVGTDIFGPDLASDRQALASARPKMSSSASTNDGLGSSKFCAGSANVGVGSTKHAFGSHRHSMSLERITLERIMEPSGRPGLAYDRHRNPPNSPSERAGVASKRPMLAWGRPDVASHRPQLAWDRPNFAFDRPMFLPRVLVFPSLRFFLVCLLPSLFALVVFFFSGPTVRLRGGRGSS